MSSMDYNGPAMMEFVEALNGSLVKMEQYASELETVATGRVIPAWEGNAGAEGFQVAYNTWKNDSDSLIELMRGAAGGVQSSWDNVANADNAVENLFG